MAGQVQLATVFEAVQTPIVWALMTIAVQSLMLDKILRRKIEGLMCHKGSQWTVGPGLFFAGVTWNN